MTGGSEMAGIINRRLAQVCKTFGMGMGLGSCRIIMESDTYFDDFNLRPILGPDIPFMANLGIAQIEKINQLGQYRDVEQLIIQLDCDGLIIHVNPLQEWLQPEGDRLQFAPLDTIKQFISQIQIPVWVKEVGQGMGYKSVENLLELPIQGFEFGAYGGTNFAKLESLRSDLHAQAAGLALSSVGHTASEMTHMLNHLYKQKPKLFDHKLLIVSGGLKNFLDGYYCIQKLQTKAIYAHAGAFLQPASEGIDALTQFVETQKNGLMAAYAYLNIIE
jgi:isopentenyl-diphosphate delta-isomerase